MLLLVQTKLLWGAHDMTAAAVIANGVQCDAHHRFEGPSVTRSAAFTPERHSGSVGQRPGTGWVTVSGGGRLLVTFHILTPPSPIDDLDDDISGLPSFHTHSHTHIFYIYMY